MIKNLTTNWKTTSAGLAMIISSVIHLVFAVSHKTADEATWTTALMGIVGGIGLLAAGDSATSSANHDETKQALTALAQAVKSGDTAVLNKTDLTKTP